MSTIDQTQIVKSPPAKTDVLTTEPLSASHKLTAEASWLWTRGSVLHDVPVYFAAYASIKLRTAWRQIYVNDLHRDALDSEVAGIEPTISNRKSNARTTEK